MSGPDGASAFVRLAPRGRNGVTAASSEFAVARCCLPAQASSQTSVGVLQSHPDRNRRVVWGIVSARVVTEKPAARHCRRGCSAVLHDAKHGYRR